jgi:hypothetical protein
MRKTVYALHTKNTVLYTADTDTAQAAINSGIVAIKKTGSDGYVRTVYRQLVWVEIFSNSKAVVKFNYVQGMAR